MGEVTAISWCDHTFNPWIGCTEVSVGELGACTPCYARELAKRYGWAEWGNHPRQKTSEANWRKPLAWDRKAAAAGTRPFVFCASLADVFDNQVDPQWRRDLIDLIYATPHLTWLLLTKRPQNILKLFRDLGVGFSWPANAAIGCTVVTQAEADRDIPHLLSAKAALNPAFAFLSMEPLMGAVDLTALTVGDGEMDALKPSPWADEIGQWRGTSDDWEEEFLEWFGLSAMPTGGMMHPTIDWVISGGMTDQGKFRARPSHPDWFRSLRDQCAAAGVPFEFKQWGAWSPDQPPSWHQLSRRQWSHATDTFKPNGERYRPMEPDMLLEPGMTTLYRHPKTSGRRLDGVEHNARPEVRTHA